MRGSKTDAGVRLVDIQPELRDELGPYRAQAQSAQAHDLVFPTATGKPDNRNNLRQRVLLRAVARANKALAHGGCDPLPAGLSPHALRRTYASWLVAEGEDPAYVMQQLGHTDPAMTLGLYAKALRSKRRRPHLENDPEAAPTGTARSEVGPGGAESNWIPDPDPHDSARWMGMRATPTYNEQYPPPET